jgi:hypothetical protein
VPASFMRIGIDIVDSIGIECVGAPDDAMNFIIFRGVPELARLENLSFPISVNNPVSADCQQCVSVAIPVKETAVVNINVELPLSIETMNPE